MVISRRAITCSPTFPAFSPAATCRTGVIVRRSLRRVQVALRRLRLKGSWRNTADEFTAEARRRGENRKITRSLWAPVLRAAFISLSESKALRSAAEKTWAGQRLSRRFVAGTTIEEALAATRAVNQLGLSVSVDNLGENVTNPDEARHSAQLYHQMLDRMNEQGLDANVSLKLTHMGLDVDEEMAFRISSNLVEHAARINNFVRIDMEGSPYTQRTLDFVRRLHRTPGLAGHVGAVVQSYLFRSEKDIEQLVAEGIRVRLCKGAYKEPPEIAFAAKADVDANYVKLMKMLLRSG